MNRLNQPEKYVKDGLEAIVCIIEGNKVQFAGSNRSVYLKNSSGIRELKGNPYYLGEKKLNIDTFTEIEILVESGNKIYMFSDGYPDQFGGPLGRKFKMVRLKNMLRDIHDKPMDEQYNYIKNNFELWKEDIEQVDDVLFMGIKI